MLKIKLVIILLCSLTFSPPCYGQYNAKIAVSSPQLTAGDTVSELSKSIWIIYHASNGYHWFGSDTSGVYVYDGKKIINYSAKDGLSSNRIRSIQEDKQGNIYVSSLGGINKFDGKTFTTLKAVKSNSSNDNWKLQPDDIWFSMLGKNGEKGPYRYDGKTLYQLEFPKHFLADDYFKRSPNNPWSPYEVYYIYKDHKGIMWFGTGNFGICRYDGKSLSWLYEDHLTYVPNGGSFGIRSIIEDKKGKFWFCNSRYRYTISPETTNNSGSSLINYKKEKGIEGIRSAAGTDHIYFLSIIEDHTGGLWMVTYNEGVWRYDGKQVTHYPVKDGPKEITLFSIYKDRKDVLWLGTHESGVYKFNGTEFEKFRPFEKQ
jgi:ligand-binding sensor domain-containing protein